jgi:hypothetical protein
LLSEVAFKFDLRRYSEGSESAGAGSKGGMEGAGVKEDEQGGGEDDGYSVDDDTSYDDTSYRGGTSCHGVDEKNVVVKMSKKFLSALDAVNTR